MDDNDFLKRFSEDFNQFYDAIVNSTDNYIFLVDMKEDIGLVSENMVCDFDLPSRLVHGLIPLWGNLILEKDKQRYNESIESMLSGKTDEHSIEYQIRNRKNQSIWVSCRGLLKHDQDGNPTIFAGIVTNLGRKGKIDATTGLYTQHECIKHVNRFLKLEDAKGGIIMLGIDDFTRINSLNNHMFGDLVLRQFAQEILFLLPERTSIYRFDGDQFVIVYKNATKEDVKQLYHRIHAYCNTKHMMEEISYFCTVSAGVAMINEDADNYLDLVKYASSALETSKQNGKNKITFFSPYMIQNKIRFMDLSNQLQDSMKQNMEGFELYYQPLVDAKSMKVIGAEALLRWSSKKYGKVSPNEFIGILERTGIINEVGKWVIEQSFATCSKWVKLIPNFVMNINVSYLQILDKNFVSYIENMITKYQLDPIHIVLELTESYFVTDMDILKDTFEKLRKLNIFIAMDDFGTGYSSLGMLSQTLADIVKIDRLFISAIDINQFNLSFINAVIELCHSIGIRVTVEGVEEEQELEAVLNIGADCIQGFYISKPLPKPEFEALFINKSMQLN